MATGISANERYGSTVSRLSNIRMEENAQNQNAGQFLSIDTVPQNMLPSNAPNNHQSNLHSSGLEREGVSGSASYSHASRRQGSNSSVGSSSASSSQSSSSTQSHPVYNWQATKTTVKERFAFMFNNEILCDVHFIVGRDIQQQRIPAHKFVLSVGSAVFDAMFNGTLATRADEIELPDVEPAAFLALLR